MREATGEHRERAIPGSEPWSVFLSSWQRWDALWYQRIAEEGYRGGGSAAAFYPLYPLLSRAAALPFGGHVVWGQLIVASLAFVVAMGLLYKLARFEVGVAAAPLAVLLTALFPTGFFLLAHYTESLFLALSLGAFWLARTGRPWAAGLVGFLAGLTRTQGLFLIVPLAHEYLRQRREWGKWPGVALLAAGLPGLGFLVYAAYLQLIVGEPRSGFELQQGWNYRIITPWRALTASWDHIAVSGHQGRGSLPAIEALNLACLLGFAVLGLAVLRRLPLMYGLYVWPSLALLFAREMGFSPLMSVSRFTLMLFPCFIVGAVWLAGRRQLAVTWLILSAVLQLMLVQLYSHWWHVA